MALTAHLIQPVSLMFNIILHYRKAQTRLGKDMIQSPRGPIDTVARNRFSGEIPESRYPNTLDTTYRHNLHSDLFTLDNQLYSNNTHKHLLSPQILHQLAYSNTLL